MGSLVKLVSDYDSIPYEDAEELICGATSLRLLEAKVHAFFSDKEQMQPVQLAEPELVKSIQLPDYTYQIDKMSSTHYMRQRAQIYLRDRKIPTTGLYVCVEGDYKNRIVIPYFNKEGIMIWYNARLMNDKKNSIKYLKCKSDGLCITQEDVLYMTSWPDSGSKIYLMEGEFDAISVSQAGLVGCALGGKFISEAQIEMIRQYEPVLAFDADEGVYKRDSGLQALINVGTALLEKGFPRVSYVRPPKLFKDWNKMLVAKTPEVIRTYAKRFEKLFTPLTPDLLLAQRL